VIAASPGAPGVRYLLHRTQRGRLKLAELNDDGQEDLVLYAAEMDVMERFLVGVVADEIRDDLGLPYLDLPFTLEDTASGFAIGEMRRGYRILSRSGGDPLAAAPDVRVSLVKLVPLSHFMGYDLPALKRSFLNETGAPLLAHGSYAPRRAHGWASSSLPRDLSG
jgi:hypothetical protein